MTYSMDKEKQIKAVLETAIKDHVFPGASVAYFADGQARFVTAGHFTYDPSSPEVVSETQYDVASVTKAIPVGCLILALVDQGVLSLDEQVIRYIPELQNQYRDQILIWHLLAYTVNFDFPDSSADYDKEGAKKILEVIYQSPLRYPPGEKFRYTDQQAILMGFIIERATGKKLNELAYEFFFKRLGMDKTTFFPSKNVPPTEITDRGEVVGEVHDETTWVLRQAGIVAGSAGLFSTAPDLLIFTRMLLAGGEYNGERYLNKKIVEAIPENRLKKSDIKMGLGWGIDTEPLLGKKVSQRAFFKTGFTGCLVVVDPIKQRSFVLLSNRTYPHRPENGDAINRVRRAISDIVFS